MKKLIEITEDEAAAIMVGMCEFDSRIYETKSGCFDAYIKITPEIVEKFRRLCWEFHEARI